MLDKAALRVGLPVPEPFEFADIGQFDTEFFPCPSLRGDLHRLARTWVAAARIRPSAPEMVFGEGPLLQQDHIVVTQDDQGERQVGKPRVSVGGHLLARACGSSRVVEDDDLFDSHGSTFDRSIVPVSTADGSS